jgi:hypothetical protein
MESLLTHATVAAEFLGFGYIAGSFVVYTRHRLNEAVQWRPRGNTTTTQASTQEPSPPKPKRKPTPVELLRQQCQQAGIKWRNAHGKNKHLKKAEMLTALQQLEQSKHKRPHFSVPAATHSTRRTETHHKAAHKAA